MKKLQLLILFNSFVAVAILATGCASVSSGSFPRGTSRSGYDVAYGQVVSTKVVEIEGEATIIGRVGGAWLGRAIGLGNSTRWYTNERRIQGAVGGIAGSIAGEAIERAARTTDGLQIVVELDRNETVAVVQGTDVVFVPGDRVQVLMGPDGSMRVQHP